ncbi:MAG: hypothetical protein C5B57_04610 [Blastocatellia bacterium]|nr:MAG: hypothetical protein C5B57_04610 [Blastocatellia bacterium]
MNSRVMAFIAALVLVFVPLVIPAFAQSAGSTSSNAWDARTPWGDPDLQGNWSGETLTPLQRPAKFAGKPVLSPEEAKQVVAEVLARPGREDRSFRGTEKDVAGAYNQLFVQRATELSDGRTSLIIDPADGRIPPLTPEAKKRVDAVRAYLEALLQGSSGGKPGPPSPRHAEPPPIYNVERMNRADGPEDRSLAERCLAGLLPNLNAVYQIVQSPGQVGIYHDSGQGQGFVRVVPVNGSQHAPATVRFWNGDARGRWEGSTLVVDITNFNNRREFQGARENLHLVERFTRVSENRLEYTVTVEDPTTWTRPWTFMVPWKKQSDAANQVYESTCHEGNYGMVGMLANTRAAERLFKQGKGKDPRTMDIATGGDTGGGIER